MKYLLFAALFIVTLLPNCKKEQMIIKTPEPIDTVLPINHIIDLGQGTLLKNGTIWNEPCRVNYHYGTKTRFSIRSEKQSPNGLREHFFISDIPMQKGKCRIEYAQKISDLSNSVPNASFGMSNYDEGIGNFYPDTTRTDNFIEVLHFDTISNEVEGRFQVFMGKRGGPSTLPGVPDSVFLTDGKFYLKLQ